MSNFALLDCAALRRSDIALNNKKRKKINRLIANWVVAPLHTDL